MNTGLIVGTFFVRRFIVQGGQAQISRAHRFRP